MPVLAYNKSMKKNESEILKIDPTEEKEIIFWPENLTEKSKMIGQLRCEKKGASSSDEFSRDWSLTTTVQCPLSVQESRKSNCRMRGKISIV